MTLAERLRELVSKFEFTNPGLYPASSFHNQYLDELRALADECEGKVTIKASVEPELKPGAIPTGRFVADLEYTYCAGIGDTKEEALADLQERIDQIGNQS